MNKEPETFNSLEQIKKICKEHGISVYKLSKESGIPYSSLNNMFNRNTDPSLSTLTKICYGLNISLSDFFSPAPSNVLLLNDEDREFMQLYNLLPKTKSNVYVLT